MLRALALCAMLLANLLAPGSGAAELPAAAPLVPAPDGGLAGPQAARGAVVWLHGSYDGERPPEPEWLSHLTQRGYDLWLFIRPSRQDPLDPGGARLLSGLAGLRQGGYQRIVVAGFSRGGFIGLAALARPDLVDAVVAVSPAAHGPRPERRPEALSAFAARMQQAGRVRLALALLHDDAFDPDPTARARAARMAAPGRAGMLLLIDRPDAPRGHMGSFEPPFAQRFAACIAAFADGQAAPTACDNR